MVIHSRARRRNIGASRRLWRQTEAPTEVTSCNCSICSKRGASHAYYTPAQFKLTTARDRVSTYQWNTYVVQHHRCSVCGCPTYGESPGFDSGKPAPRVQPAPQ